MNLDLFLKILSVILAFLGVIVIPFVKWLMNKCIKKIEYELFNRNNVVIDYEIVVDLISKSENKKKEIVKYLRYKSDKGQDSERSWAYYGLSIICGSSIKKYLKRRLKREKEPLNKRDLKEYIDLLEKNQKEVHNA